MRSIPDLSGLLTQAEFGRLVGRSEGRISQLVTDGTLAAGGTGLEWLQAFINRLSNEAAGRHTDGPLDLAQERAALARSQREAVDLKNAVSRGEYAPRSMLKELLATASQSIVERLDQLPGQLKRSCPQLDDAGRDRIMATVADARNEWVRATAELVVSRMDLGDDDDDDSLAVEDVDDEP